MSLDHQVLSEPTEIKVPLPYEFIHSTPGSMLSEDTDTSEYLMPESPVEKLEVIEQMIDHNTLMTADVGDNQMTLESIQTTVDPEQSPTEVAPTEIIEKKPVNVLHDKKMTYIPPLIIFLCIGVLIFTAIRLSQGEK
jgi:hypothetical protein